MQIVNSEGNYVTGEAHEMGKCVVAFKGLNNKLIIGSNVRLTNVSISFNGSNATIEFFNATRLTGRFLVGDSSTILVGARTKFNKPCRLHAWEGKSIKIGEECLFANVRFRTSDSHSIIDLETGARINHAADISIGDRVWFAEDVNVYKGVSIGAGSVIGTGAIVVKSIPENCLAVGVPAKVIKRNITWTEKLL